MKHKTKIYSICLIEIVLFALFLYAALNIFPITGVIIFAVLFMVLAMISLVVYISSEFSTQPVVQKPAEVLPTIVPPTSSEDDSSSKMNFKEKEMERKLEELERLNNSMIGRELTMIELKKELERLKKRLGENVEENAAEKEEIAREIEFFKRNNSTIEETKNALYNVMEDLERNRLRLEQEFVRDEALIDSIGDGMITTDSSGKITLINNAAEYMLGWKLDEIKGKSFEEIIKAESDKFIPLSKEELPVYESLATKQKVTITVPQFIYYTRKDTTKFPVSVTVTPVIIHSEIWGTLTIFRDVTEEKEIDRMKTEFISLASHQLRTPLSAIKWFSEMLLDGDAGDLSKEQKELMVSLHDSTIRMIDLVNAILNISRMESGRIIVDPQLTDLPGLVNEIIKELQVKLHEKNQKLTVSIYEQLPHINVDPKLIREVYVNLLTNAIKYTPNNGEITVILSRKGDEIISQVSDNGYGIPQASRGKIFQKFFRADNIVKYVTDGSGLGLYLVKAIVESSHGKIWFESEEGKGTTFWFTIPMAGVEAKAGEVTLDS